VATAAAALQIPSALQAALEHHQAGRLPEAEAIYRQILQAEPNHPDALHLLGMIAYQTGSNDIAVGLISKAIVANPSNAIYYNNLGNALRDQGELDAALTNYRKALALKPDYANAHNNLGVVLQAQGQPDEAIASFHKALALKPDFVGAHNNLGNALTDRGMLDAAVERYRKALALKPDHMAAHSSLLYLHAFTRDIAPESECGLAANWENIALSEPERSVARDRRWSFDVLARAGRKLKVGVVSAEIGEHAVAEFLEPLLEQLDRNRFHITLYPTAVRVEARAARLRALADDCESLVRLSDDKAADRIRADRIDVLIDTTAHMAGCRLGIFAHRAAPVQCHYIGYHGTTGLTEMDWLIADEVLLPRSCDAHFREGIWRLPRLWIAYRGDGSLPDSNWRPDPDGAVWLGSFNNLTKVREQTLGLWAKVMHAVPESRLLLKDRKAVDHAVQERIRTGLLRHGVSGERVEFVAWTPAWSSHMALYDRLDIALDTVPLNSGTTALDALWMGVPLVALEGNWMGGRMTSTVLRALGKPEWIARNDEEYVAIVAGLARDIEGRKSLRAAQRSLMAGSPLCDAKGLARVLETAFEAMFERWLSLRDQSQHAIAK
jgi:predicted O-linked N-acetylglucosamine transferase (SPINDLY family)